MNEDKIKQQVKEQIARNLVDTLAVSFIAKKIGIDIEKVEEFRREYEEGLYRTKLCYNCHTDG